MADVGISFLYTKKKLNADPPTKTNDSSPARRGRHRLALAGLPQQRVAGSPGEGGV
jgi:hypothetical protein